METNKLVQAFETELNLTEQGLRELSEQKKGLVIDVKTEAGFKLARKERTEQNKLIKNIDDLAISGKRSVDEVRETLKERVTTIYAPIVTAFEAEDIRRKEEAKRLAQIEAERIQKIREKINSISAFAMNVNNKSSEELQDIIEAVDMIDVSENFAELTQEALAVKKETLASLSISLTSAIQNEQLSAEREALRVEQEKIQEEKRVNELKAKAQERLNNLIMIPSTMFGKSSLVINQKTTSLIGYEVKESEFGELFDSANAAKSQVIQQLNVMSAQQELVEKAQAQSEADQAAKHEEELQAQRPEFCDREFQNDEPLQPLPATTKSPVTKPIKTVKTPSTRDISVFLQTLNDDSLNDFGYLLLSGDISQQQEALANIRNSFSLFLDDLAA